MSPSELAVQALAIVAPLLIKGGEAITQGIGKDLWEGIKNVFKKENKENALEKFQLNPQDEQTKEAIKAHLTSILFADEFAKENLQKLVSDYNNQQGNNIQAINNEKSIVTGSSISGSTITIS
jgi:hypothetical protein